MVVFSETVIVEQDIENYTSGSDCMEQQAKNGFRGVLKQVDFPGHYYFYVQESMTAYTGYKLFIKGEMDQHLNDAPVTEHKQEICSTFKN